MVRDAALSVRVADEVKRALEVAAAEDRRTLAGLVEKIVVDWLTREGRLTQHHPVDDGAPRPKPVSTRAPRQSRRRVP